MYTGLTGASYAGRKEGKQEMKPLHNLDAATSGFETLIGHDLKVLKKAQGKNVKGKRRQTSKKHSAYSFKP